MNTKAGLLFSVLLVTIISISACAVLSNKKFAEEKKVEPMQEIQTENINTVEEQASIYLHGWNMAAYANESQIRFYGNVDRNGDFVFTGVNIDIKFSDPEDVVVHQVLVQRVSAEWFQITGSRIVRIIDSKGVLVMWSDKDGEIHMLKRKGKNV